MKKIIIVTALLVILAFMATGCGSNPEIKPLPIPEQIVVAPEPAPLPEAEQEPNDEDKPLQNVEYGPENMHNGIPIVGVRDVKDGLFQSYLTGGWKDVNISARRPIGLMIPNNKAALPQYAISRADIVFEAAVEGRTSRLIAFFEDYDDLDHIGPTRSARDYFVYEAIGKHAIFCHWGLAVPYSADLINGPKVDNVSAAVTGINRSADEAFVRIPRPGYAREFTGYLSISGYNKAISRLDYPVTYSADFIPQFIFAAENTTAEYNGYPGAKVIRPGGTSNNKGGFGDAKSYFEFNEDDGLYYRYQYSGKHIDEMTNSQLTYSNIVFQYANGEKRDANDYLAFGVHGEDKAIVFTNGKAIEGTWKRFGGDLTPAKFYDENGVEIVFNQGKTWICLIWNDYKEYAEWE